MVARQRRRPRAPARRRRIGRGVFGRRRVRRLAVRRGVDRGVFGGSLGCSASGGASQGAAASGTITVWAMGNEGVKLKDLAASFMKDNPGTTVNVTPVDWGQAVAKLQTAIAGHQTPDVSQMGTDMMGQFAATGAFENVPASVDKSKFFESAWNTNVVERRDRRRAVVRRDPAALLPQGHRREGRHHRRRPPRGTTSRPPPRR